MRLAVEGEIMGDDSFILNADSAIACGESREVCLATLQAF
jgi:hypothetical protein